MQKINASLIRQFVFCPRIFYFYIFCDITLTYPQHVKMGSDFHDKQAKLFKSRNFTRLGLNNYQAFCEYYLECDGLCGVCDMLFVNDAEIVVLEFKNNENLTLNQGTKMQLLAYAKMASKIFAKPCKRVILCSSNYLKHKVFKIFDDDFAKLDNVLLNMKKIINNEVFPNSSASLNACHQCEFFNYCDDRE